MKTSTYLRWAGWSVLASAISIILSVTFTILGYSIGSLTFGTHTHSVIVETFDVLITGCLLPLPLAFYLIYRPNVPRLSFWSALVGTITLLAATILHVLFVFEVMWFSDPISLYLYAAFGIGFICWLIMTANLAYRTKKPAHGALVNIIGATVVGFPIWAFSIAYLLVAGKFSDQLA